MADEARVIRVAVVGDPGVGKTSLISTAAHDTFDARPVPVLPPTRLPANFTRDGVPMLIQDCSSRPEDQQVLDLVLRQCDVVVVCFDATRQTTLDSVRSSWYPRVQALNPDVPLVMACCKADRITDERDVIALRERVERSVHDLPHVEVCLNCSACTLRMVSDVFFYALKSVLYPLHPLYDRLERKLHPLCVRALKRVFMMCDEDGDGALNDAELSGFQLTCFGQALEEGELQNVKQMVASKMPAGVTAAGVTLEGFLFLHVLFIERGRLESTWAVLRKFGYSDNLLLSDKVLDRVNFDLPPDQVWCLSDVALTFLKRQFALYDEDVDGLISWQQLDAMYSTLPPPVWQGDPWSRLLVPGVYGAAHRLEAFLLKWQFEAMTDPRSAYAHLLYLGFGGPDGAGGRVLLTLGVRRQLQKRHRQDLAARSCIQCLVFGAPGAGKTGLLKALVGQRPEAPSPARATSPTHTGSSAASSFQAAASPTVSHALPGGFPPAAPSALRSPPAAAQSAGDSMGARAEPRKDGATPLGGFGAPMSQGPPCAVGLVRGVDDRERTLLLQEVTEDIQQEVLTTAALSSLGPPLLAPAAPSTSLPSLAHADVAVFVFDSSSAASFRAAVELLVQVFSLAGENLPCVLVAAKDELVMSAALEAEVAATTASLKLPLPVRTSSALGECGALFSTLVSAALLQPEVWCPETPAHKARRRFMRQVLVGSAVAATAAAAAYLGYRYLTYVHAQRSQATAASSGGTTSGASHAAASGSNSSASLMEPHTGGSWLDPGFLAKFLPGGSTAAPADSGARAALSSSSHAPLPSAGASHMATAKALSVAEAPRGSLPACASLSSGAAGVQPHLWGAACIGATAVLSSLAGAAGVQQNQTVQQPALGCMGPWSGAALASAPGASESCSSGSALSAGSCVAAHAARRRSQLGTSKRGVGVGASGCGPAQQGKLCPTGPSDTRHGSWCPPSQHGAHAGPTPSPSSPPQPACHGPQLHDSCQAAEVGGGVEEGEARGSGSRWSQRQTVGNQATGDCGGWPADVRGLRMLVDSLSSSVTEAGMIRITPGCTAGMAGGPRVQGVTDWSKSSVMPRGV